MALPLNEQVPDFAAERLKFNWAKVLEMRQGRAVVMDILRMCHYGKSAYTGDRINTDMITGKQLVGEGVTDMMAEVKPDAFMLMLKEAQEDSLDDRSTQQRADDEYSV